MRSVSWFVVALSICVAALGTTALAQQGGGWFGAEVVDVTKAEADKLGWDAPHGAKVSRIEPGSPAEKAGLKVGDIILALDRTVIDNAADFTASLESRRSGAEVRLRVLSDGREIGVAVVLGERRTVTAAKGRRSSSSIPAGIWASSEALISRRMVGRSCRPGTTR